MDTRQCGATLPRASKAVRFVITLHTSCSGRAYGGRPILGAYRIPRSLGRWERHKALLPSASSRRRGPFQYQTRPGSRSIAQLKISLHIFASAVFILEIFNFGMQQDENEGKPMAREKDDTDNSKLGNDADEDDVMDGPAATYEDDELPESLSLGLSQWASKLCLVCRMFLEGKIYDVFEAGKRYMFHTSLSSLRSSVHSGCPLCKQLSESLDNYYKGDGLGTLRKSGSIKCTVFDGIENFLQSKSKADSVELTFRLFDDDDCMVGEYDFYGFETFRLYPVRGLGGLGPEFLGALSDTNSVLVLI